MSYDRRHLVAALAWGSLAGLQKLRLAERIVFEQDVTLLDGDSIAFERDEQGRTVRVRVTRKDGTVEEVPFSRSEVPTSEA